jgi:phytoene/squalene synthetase
MRTNPSTWPLRFFHGVDHAENFPVASVLLPRDMRSKVMAIYGLARFADDLADEGPWTVGQRLAFLQELSNMLAGSEPGPWLKNAELADKAKALFDDWRIQGLDQQANIVSEMQLMLSAFSWDARGFWPETGEQFERYCRGSAASVGRILLALHRVEGAACLESSDAICTALQRINMLQDCAIDAKRGRIYIPACELRAMGYQAEDWFRFCAAGQLPDHVRQWVGLSAKAQLEQLRLHQHVVAELPLRLALELRAVIAAAASIARAMTRSPDPVMDRPRMRKALSGTGSFRLLRDWIFGLSSDA